MNREIKFRGICVIKGEFEGKWVYGDLLQRQGKTYIAPHVNSVSVTGNIGKLLIMHEVDPQTVGQHVEGDSYTGDIFCVVCDCDSEFGCSHPAENYEQIWHEQYLQYGFRRGDRFVLLDEFGVENIHLIGNIYEHPRLLEEPSHA